MTCQSISMMSIAAATLATRTYMETGRVRKRICHGSGQRERVGLVRGVTGSCAKVCFLLGPSSQISNESLKSDKQGKEDRQSDELQGLDNSTARAACFAMAVLVENPPLLAGPTERTGRAIYALSRAGHVQSRLVAVAWVPTAEKAEGGIPDRARGERASGWALHSTLYGWFGSKVQTTISHPSSGTVVGVAVADLYRPRGTCISSPPRQDSTT